MKRKAHIVSFEMGCGSTSCFRTSCLPQTLLVFLILFISDTICHVNYSGDRRQISLFSNRRKPNLFFAAAGAEGMQDTGDVGVFLGSATKWLHHQPCLQLGGPSGSERLSPAGRAGRQPEEGGREDGNNLFCRTTKMICRIF